MQKDLQDYRKSYERDQLSEGKVPLEPLALFASWFKDAEEHPEIGEPNAMSLATIGKDQFPKTRVVLLKSFGPEGFTFFTNYNSEKARDLAQNPGLCLSFFWPALERQIIIKGKAIKTSERESSEYFRMRPRGSQLSAWASNQSEEISSREVLEDEINDLKKKFEGKEIPRPAHWGGYLVRPVSFEFWQGRQNRLHDRIIFTSVESKKWIKKRLAP